MQSTILFNKAIIVSGSKYTLLIQQHVRFECVTHVTVYTITIL